ncbi:MAG: ATP-binding protein [Woeseiaceae bacterium]|nr:ATP-binding protein [Woeseiaceae bacterium]
MAALSGGHRRFLLRSYLLLVAALLAVAVGLQYGYEYLLASRPQQADPWLEATLALAATRLENASPDERQRIAGELSRQIGVGVQLLERNDVAMAADVALEPLVDEDGNTWYLYTPAALDSILYVGPVATVADPAWVRFVPVLFYLSIFVVVGLWLRPLLLDIKVMTGAAQRFAADYRTPLETADQVSELTVLANTLDDMSKRLSGMIQTQKELIAALSHEMRTPLARIRFALAVIDGDGDDRTPGRIEAIKDDLQEVDALISTMLDYARLDHPDLQMHWQDVPVRAWLEQVLEKYRDLGKELQVDVEEGIDAAPMDPRLMTLALSNLVSNACRHANSTLRVAVSVTDDGYAIRVDDDGSGVPEDARDAVFKAFARLDDSRSRDTGGYGLGLAIVARIAELHGGRALVGDAEDLGGASFTISWAAPPL